MGFSLNLGVGGASYTPNSVLSFPQNTNGQVMSSQQPDGWAGVLSTLSGTALEWYKTVTAADLANTQIKNNQYPTVIGQNGQLSGTANISSTSALAGSNPLSMGMLLVILIAVAVLMIIRR